MSLKNCEIEKTMGSHMQVTEKYVLSYARCRELSLVMQEIENYVLSHARYLKLSLVMC